MAERIRGVYGKPWADKFEIKVTPATLKKIGAAIVKRLSEEAKKDFAKRGWTGKDPMGGPDIGDSFSFRVGASSVEITSTFYGMRELTTGDIPARRMVWLTQSKQNRLKVAKGPGGKPVYRQGKMPLVIPIKEKSGEVVFRTAPLTVGDAWIHPGIAKYTFVQRAIKMAHEDTKRILAGVIRDALLGKKSP